MYKFPTKVHTEVKMCESKISYFSLILFIVTKLDKTHKLLF